MKTNKSALMIIAIGSLFTASSCSVEYRARHPRPRPKRVIVVGKAENEQQKTNAMPEQQQPYEVNVAAY